ncbi:MAG: hypothetical protein WCP12_10755 [bacterium]
MKIKKQGIGTRLRVGLGILVVCGIVGSVRAATGTWDGTDSTWDTSATHWTGVSGTPWDATNGGTNVAKFNTGGARAVVSGTVYANGLTFDAAATVTNGTLAFAGTAAPVVTVTGASVTGEVFSALSVRDYNKAGTGTLVLKGASSAALTNMTGGGSFVLSGSGTMTNASVGPIYIGNSSANNSVTLTGASAYWNANGNNLNVGYGVWTATNNVFTITSGATMTNVAVVDVGSLPTGSSPVANTLVISGGGRLYSTNSSLIGAAGGTAGGNNKVLVTGTNAVNGQSSLWDLAKASLTIGGGGGAPDCNLTIDNGGVVTNAGSNILKDTRPSLIITNGGKFYSTGITKIQGTSANILVGANSVFDNGGYSLQWNATSITNTVTDGGVLVNANFGAFNIAGFYNNLIITNGGKVYFGKSAASYLTSRGGFCNTVTVTGASSLLDNGGQAFYVSYADNTTYGENGNSLQVTAGGVVSNITTLSVGNYKTNAWNSAQVTSGGLLEIKTGITVGLSTDGGSTNNTVLVSGGILQFTTAAPTITVANNSESSANSMTLTNAVVSFRAITNATVLCSKSGNQLTNALWLGGNTFRLNAATNAAGGQAYTFANTLGSTNFVALSLLNGACWRGGAATISSGGALEVGAGANYLVTNVTFESGSELRVSLDGTAASSLLSTSGALTLGGALKVTLGFAPVKNVEYPVIQTTGAGTLAGAFASSKVTASYGGNAYELIVRKTATTVSVVWATKGTFISFM